MHTREQILDAVNAAMHRRGLPHRIRAAQRLTGGAASATWRLSLDTSCDRGRDQALILRMSQSGGQTDAAAISTALSKATEATLIERMHALGAGAPEIVLVLRADDDLGEGFIMHCLPGEALPQRILRDPAYAPGRAQLTMQCAQVLSRIHSADTSTLPDLPVQGAREQLAIFETLYRQSEEPLPVFEFALRRLHAQLPPATDAPALVHGDFRTGNLLLLPDTGLSGVLDWELAHLGDPMEDLGWLCVNSWRFGQRDQPVGGFGQRAELFNAYAAATGVAVDPARVQFWELFGVFKWGVMCLMMSGQHLRGELFSLEFAAIGRRVSETEIDLLDLLDSERASA